MPRQFNSTFFITAERRIHATTTAESSRWSSLSPISSSSSSSQSQSQSQLPPPPRRRLRYRTKGRQTRSSMWLAKKQAADEWRPIKKKCQRDRESILLKLTVDVYPLCPRVSPAGPFLLKRVKSPSKESGLYPIFMCRLTWMRFHIPPLAGGDEEVFSSSIMTQRKRMEIGSDDCLESCWSATNCPSFPLSVWPNDLVQAHAHMHSCTHTHTGKGGTIRRRIALGSAFLTRFLCFHARRRGRTDG